MLDFGSVFRHRENFYVFLVQTEDVIYAAKICDKEMTALLVKTRDAKIKNPRNMTTDKPLYCFVVLSTKQLEGQAAHYGDPSMPTDIGIEPLFVLEKPDQDALMKEITADTAANIVLRKVLTELSSKK